MVRRRDLYPRPIFDAPALIQFLADHDVKPLHAHRIWKHLLVNPGCDLAQIPDLPVGFGAVLAKEFVYCSSAVVHAAESQVDHTVKLLVRLQDGKEVEAVLINHAGDFEQQGEDAHSPKEVERENLHLSKEHQRHRVHHRDARHALCVSSQVGCRLGCTFCATGKLGLDGNLCAGEIIEQVLHARAYGRPVHSVVFMGMGEPLENTDAVLSAIGMLVDSHCFSMAPRSITVSTVGLVPQMRRLMQEAPAVRLSLSLHAPTQKLRETIMPVARAYSLEQVMSVVDAYTTTRKGAGGSARQRNTMIAYVLIADVNDSDACARDLAALLSARPVFVNVIPYNPVETDGSGYQTPTPNRIAAFLAILAQHNICAFERRHHGRDIAAACGQLARTHRIKQAVDIEDCSCSLGKQKARESCVSNSGDKQLTVLRSYAKIMVFASGLLWGIVASFVLLRRRRCSQQGFGLIASASAF